MKHFSTLLLFALILSFSMQAQNAHKFCGHDAALEKARKDNPKYDAEYNQFLESALSPENVTRLNDSVYTVQVVFHVLYNANDSFQNVSDDLIHSQLDALNRDFNRRNSDTINTRPIFEDFAANAKIEFVLAKRRPNGSCDNAIIRKPYSAPSNFLPIFLDFLVKEDWSGGSRAWDTRKYLNIWVLDLNKGRADDEGFLGGYAYFPELTPVQYNGVVVDYRFFGQDNPVIAAEIPGFSIYAQGRACVHEVGHWLGLRHIWGDAGTLDPSLGCSADDGIDDTPNASVAYASNGLCFDTIVNSCVDEPIDYPDMYENYMDYSSDDCQNLFTNDQVTVMRSSITQFRTMIPFTPELNTTETQRVEITENETAEFCFDLGICFGIGNTESKFQNEDVSITTENGEAVLDISESCFSYTAAAYNPLDDADTLTIVTYDEHFREYDTTVYIIKINEDEVSTSLAIESSIENKITVYPNPTQGVFTIKNERPTDVIEVAIFNTVGKKLQDLILTNASIDIDISNYGKGIYILSFTHEESISFEKVILE